MTAADPTRNIVLFTLGPNPDDALAAEVRAQDADGIRRAWKQVVAEHGVRPEQVTELYAEWQPSMMDTRYIEQTFGDIGVRYSFARPKPDGWDAALAEARTVIEAAAERHAATEMDEAATGLVESTQDAVVLPILRSASLPNTEFVMEQMPSWAAIGDEIYVTMAHVAMTPRGTIGMKHVLHHDIADDDFATRMSEAVTAVTDGLVMDGLDTEDGEMIRLRREDGLLAAAAILLPDFHNWVSGVRDWPELIVAIFCPDTAYIAPAGSPCAANLRRQIQEAEQEAPEFRPSLLRITADTRELILEGGR